MKYSLLILVVMLGLVMPSCSSSKMNKKLLYHSTQLEQLVEKDISAPAKVDVLAALMVEVLEESLTFNKTKDSVKFLKSYSNQNKGSIDKLYEEVARWYNGLSASQKVVETARLATKPYVRQLLNIAPKVEKKVKRKLDTIFFFGRFAKLLKLLV